MYYGILGPLRIARDDNTIIQVRQARQRALATVLLLHGGGPLPPERLISMLWDEDPPARGAIRTHIWALRRLLAPADLIFKDVTGYWLDVRSAELDLETFRQLAERGTRTLENGDPATAADLLGQALALWREPVLEDLPPTLALTPLIHRLLDERQVVREALIDARIRLGQDRGLLPELQAAIAEHPARERFSEQLMLVLYRTGRRADALNAYCRIRSALAAEYGIDPGPVLQLLHHRILTDDPALNSLTA